MEIPGLARDVEEQGERLFEYTYTLKNYVRDIPAVLAKAGVTHEESSQIVNALTEENFPTCQHLLQNAYKRVKGKNNHAYRLDGLAKEVEIISRFKIT
ncbi:hypothetical protein ACFLZB_00080 [Nanoarchaeota archaeon]